MASYKLTIRHGSKVTREGHESLTGALEALRSNGERIRAEGDLPEVSMIRTTSPATASKPGSRSRPAASCAAEMPAST